MYALFATYNTMEDFLRVENVLNGDVLYRVYLSYDSRLEPIPQLNSLKLTRQVTVQIVESQDLVRCLIFIVGAVERRVVGNTIQRDEPEEARLKEDTEAVLNITERYLAERGWMVERGQIAMPVFLQFSTGVFEFIERDEATGSFRYKSELLSAAIN